jgi:hypothetical protein
MGLDALLILFGIVGQAVSNDESSSLENVAETCLQIGLAIVAVEVLLFLIVLVAGLFGVGRMSRRSRW